MPASCSTHGAVAGLDLDMESLAQQVLSCIDEGDSELSIVLCDDAFIEPLNRDYRGKNSATDVLSFSQREGEFADAGDPTLGDVIISLETAARQAATRGHSLEHETTVLLIHGILHLVGYDHILDDEAETMQAEEHRILTQL